MLPPALPYAVRTFLQRGVSTGCASDGLANFTSLIILARELRGEWLEAKLERMHQITTRKWPGLFDNPCILELARSPRATHDHDSNL